MIKKTYILGALILFISSGIYGQERVKWYSITEAIELNKKEPRMLVIDVYTDWCGWCKRMDAGTFSDPAVAEYMNTNFYPVKLNGEGKEDITIGDQTYKYVKNGNRGYHELAAAILQGRLSYPSIAWLDQNLQIVQVVPGYRTSDQFLLYLAYFNEKAYEKLTFMQYTEQKQD